MSATCLIGESDTFLSRLLTRYCEAAGMAVMRAQRGEELLELALAQRPDLIIVDAELPGEVRGWEAIADLQTSSECRSTKFIACSWLPAAEAMMIAPGCAAYLQKPDLHYDDFVVALKDAGFEPARS